MATVQSKTDVMDKRYDTVTGIFIPDYVIEGIKGFISDHPDETGFACSIGMTAVGIVGSILFGRRVFAH